MNEVKMSESAVEKIQFSGAVQEIQTLFFDVYVQLEQKCML